MTEIPPLINVATQIFPFFSNASESNLFIPPSLFNSFPPLIDIGNGNFSTFPSSIIL